jgi:hypothetical protein
MTKSRFLASSMFVALSFAVLIGLPTTLSAGDDPIGNVSVTADPESFAGRCPVTIKFTGTIEVLAYPMTFNYHWERSDGAKGPVHVVRVPSPRTRTITVVDTWRLGSQGQNLNVWQKLHVNCGNTHIVSEPASASISCR